MKISIKHYICTITMAVLMMLSTSSVARSEVSVNLNIDIPLPVPTIVISEPPEFIMPAALGFYVAVGTAYDIFRVENSYYLYRDNRWFIGPYYNGPWRVVKYEKLPRVIRHHNYDRIVYYRDMEYKHYRKNPHGYGGKFFKPSKSNGGHGGGKHHKDKGGHHQNHHDNHNDNRNDNRNDNSQDWNPWTRKHNR